MNNTFSYTMKAPCVFSVWPIWAFIISAKTRHLEFLLLIPMEKKITSCPAAAFCTNERSITRCSDNGRGSSLFKKLAGRGGHYRVMRCASGMAICLPHEAASRVACRHTCILIGLICSTIGRCRLTKKMPKLADWSAGRLIGWPLSNSLIRFNDLC